MIALSALVILLLLWAVYALLPTLRGKYMADNSLGRWGICGKKLLLTFDDGPDPEYTRQLLAVLGSYGIKAVFFLPAFKAEQYPQLASLIIREGHEIGLHGYAHRNPWLRSPGAMRRDFDQAEGLWRQLGICSRFYRPPHGNITLANQSEMRRRGFTPLLWTVICGDWLNRGETSVLDKLVDGLCPGAVILLHDSGDDTGGQPGAPAHTISALAQFIPLAQAAGYSFVNPKEVILYEGNTK